MITTNFFINIPSINFIRRISLHYLVLQKLKIVFLACINHRCWKYFSVHVHTQLHKQQTRHTDYMHCIPDRKCLCAIKVAPVNLDVYLKA